MILFPAIDMKDGQCVRLVQGDFDKKKVYSENPLVVAKSWQKVGCENLHVVDLDGAKSGISANGAIIETIIQETGLKVQVGGGIRTLDNVKYWLEKGVERVILGTSAVENPALVEAALALAPDKICVSVDAKDGFVATNGWQVKTNVEALSFIQQLESVGVQTIVYTDIAKDGMLLGPNLAAYEELKAETNVKIIASGGVGSLADLQALKQFNVYGAITGKALYENKFTLEEALLCVEESSLV